MSKMDAIKVSIENDSKEDGEKAEGKKEIKKKRVVKTTKVKPAKKKTVIEKTKTKSGKKGIFSHLFVFIFTASVVGGGIYYWQSGQGQIGLDKLQSDARNTRISLEEKISSIKTKLQGVEDENEELKETKKELEEKAVLLDGALKKYSNSDLLFSFHYPVLFGDVKIDIQETENGKKFKGTFSDNDQLVFGGVSADYVVASTTTMDDAFLDTLGFTKDGDDIFYKNVHGETPEVEVEAMRVVGTRYSESVMLNKDSFVVEGEGAEEEAWDFGLGQDIGAVVNLKLEDFSGIAFINKSTATFPLADFEELLKSIEVKESE